ncbi:uncharacterized protein LOC141589264 [Silene latifolia]|uniref:uncharacterized protein LOC141589264 n=1 Tax=Silene latifolia TaxID=37657 RepID=UPI003D78910C
MYIDTDALIEFFVDQSLPSTGHTIERRAEEKTAQASGQDATVVTSFPKPTPLQIKSEGLSLIRLLAKWADTAGALIVEQEKTMAEAAPQLERLRLELDAANKEAKRAKAEAEEAVRAERRLREDAEKEVLAERAKAEAAAAEAAKLLEGRDLVQKHADLYRTQRDEWRGMFQTQGKVVRNKDAIITQRE